MLAMGSAQAESAPHPLLGEWTLGLRPQVVAVLDLDCVSQVRRALQLAMLSWMWIVGLPLSILSMVRCQGLPVPPGVNGEYIGLESALRVLHYTPSHS